MELYNLPSKEFSLERVIAEGSFGIVRMCRRRSNNELLAAKIPKNSICTPIEVWSLCTLTKKLDSQYNNLFHLVSGKKWEFWNCVVSADSMYGSVDESQI